MITLLRQATLWAIVPAVTQGLSDLCAADARLACPAWIDHQHLAPGAFSLGAKYLLKSGPSGISNRPGQPAVPEHSLNVQAFRSDQAEATNQTNSHLVVVFLAKVGHTGVQLGHLPAGLAPIAPTLLLAAEAPAQSTQFRQFLLEESGIVDRLPLTGGEEVRQANINSDLRVHPLRDVQFAQITGQNDKPLATFPLDAQGLDVTLPGAVELYTDCADVLKAQAIASNPATVAVRGELKAVEEIPALESWEPGLGSLRLHPAEEVGVRLFEAAHGSLRCTEVDAGVESVYQLRSLKPARLLGVLDRFARQLESLNTLGKAFVVQPAMRLQGNCQFTLLVGVGEEAVFECLAHELPPLLVLDVPCHNRAGNRSNRPGVITATPKCWEPAPQFGKLLAQHPGSETLDPVDYLSDTQCRVAFYKQVNMIRHDAEVVDNHIQLATLLVNQADKPLSNLPGENRAAVLWAPHDVVLEAENCTSVFAVSGFHTALYGWQADNVQLGPKKFEEGAHSPAG